jgi:hypothetical protein
MGILQFNNDNVIIVMIILVILIIFKPVLYFFSITNSNNPLIKDETFEKFRVIYTYILDIIITFIATYILFFRKNNSVITLILATIIIFKSFITFFIQFQLYKNVNLSNNTIKNIKAYEKQSLYISNAVLFFVASYILTKIFYN